MTRILLNGCNGRMGQAITKIAAQTDGVEIAAGIDLYDGIENAYAVYPSVDSFSGEADVIIDFSNPSSFDGLISYAIRTKTPIVVATTGLSTEQKARLEAASAEIAVFYSANMSLGINLLIELAQKAAKLLEGSYDIEIVERHHNQKLDAPSGTALAIADGISEVLECEPEYVYDRHSVRKKRSKTEIGIHAVRGGTIVGDHSVIFAGTDEVIELNHSANSRDVFAVGAVRAAGYMAGKPAGMYSMKDLVSSMTE